MPHRLLKPVLRLLTFDFLRNPTPKVAVLPLRGVIGSAGRIHGKGLTVDELRENIAKAFAIGNVKAVALAINSPGGAPVQAAMIHDAIRAEAEEKRVPVYAFAEDVCASGGYWLACAGEEIYAHPASIVGSIGVIASGFGLEGFIARHGISRRVYTQGENKAMLDPFLPEREEDIHRLLAAQRDVHDAFKQHVINARSRKLNADGDELFSGAFWSGKQARDIGLVDGLGGMAEIMREKYGKNVKFIYLKPKKSLFSGLLGGKASLSRHWVEELLETVETRGIWQRFGL